MNMTLDQRFAAGLLGLVIFAHSSATSVVVFAAPRVDVLDEDTTVITSDGGLNLDYAKHVAIFKRNVMVKDHRGTLKAQEMQVFFEPEGSKIDTIIAKGDVHIVQEGGRVAESQNALIKSLEGVIELTGDPKIRQGKDIYSAEKITIFSKTNQVIFEPRAKLIIYQPPGEKKALF